MPLTFQEFSAWVEVNGAELPIFNIEENSNEVTCWIPSESDKNFSIKWTTGKRNTSMAGDIYVDGQALSGKAMYAGLPQCFTSSGVLTSATTERPFMFSRLELTDDDEYLNKATTGLGEVKLVICRATHGQTNNQYLTCDPVGKVHEKSKKATGHKVGFGADKFISPTNMASNMSSLTSNRIMLIRTQDMLRANGIAPPDERKKRSAPTSEPEVMDLTDDHPNSDEEEEERRIKELKAELETLERKRRKTKHCKSEPGLKQEPGTSTRNKRNSQIVSLGVVDLT